MLWSFLCWLAAISTLWYLMKILMMCLGNDDGDAGAELDSAGDIDASFKLLTTQSLAAFGMGFAWLGLALLKQTALSPAVVLSLGALNGTALMLMTAFIMRSLRRLNSPDRLWQPGPGDRGRAYTTIAAGGHLPGLVQVFAAASHQARQYTGLTHHEQDIRAHTEVVVEAFINDTVWVRPVANDSQTQRIR